MKPTLMNKYGIKQIGYYVENLEKSAQKFANIFGAGPFVDLGISAPPSIIYRGKNSDMRCRCALGQLNDMQIELIEVQTEGPDVYKEMGRYGLHHLCIWSDDADKAIAELESSGMEIAMEMVSGQGLHVVYFDTRELLGSYLEVHEPIEQLWQSVKALAEGSDQDTPTLVSIQTMMDYVGR